MFNPNRDLNFFAIFVSKSKIQTKTLIIMMQRLLILLGFVYLSMAPTIYAQDFDDIYFDSSKEKKSTKTIDQSYQNSRHFSSNRDIDEYNRRGNYLWSQDSMAYDTIQNSQDFKYTERIKRFYNPSVITESNDSSLIDMYVYTRPEVNIIIGTPSYYSPWGTFYCGYYDYGFYDPWCGWRDPWYYSSFYYPWGRPLWHSAWRFYDLWWGYDPFIPSYGYGHWHSGHIGHPSISYGWNNGNRRPVGVGSRNNGIHYGNSNNRYNGSNRIGNIIHRPGNIGLNGTNRNNQVGGTYRGGNIRFGTNGQNNNSSFRRPGNINRDNSSFERQNNSYDNNQRSSSRSSFDNNSSSGFGRGRDSFGGGRMGGGNSSNGARGGGHRR